MRIGLISDTHISRAGRDPSTGLKASLWPQVYEALRSVDLIMHAGDLLLPEVIDWLEEVAPVMAVWGNGDFGGWERREAPQDPRLSESKVLPLDDLRIGLVHDFPLPESPPLRTVEGLMSHYFGGPVDVIVRGSTHRAEITRVRTDSGQEVLVVNPGSPTFPNHQSLRLGTIGFLEIQGTRVKPSILQLR